MIKVTLQMKNQAACTRKVISLSMEKGYKLKLNELKKLNKIKHKVKVGKEE